MSAYLTQISPANEPVHQSPTIRADAGQGADGRRLEMKIHHPAVRILWTTTRQAEYLSRPQPALSLGSAFRKKCLEACTLDQPGPQRRLRRQALVLDPPNNRLPVNADCDRSLPDGVDLMTLDALG